MKAPGKDARVNLDLEQHNREIQQNLRAWKSKPLLRKIYADFYRRIAVLIDPSIPGQVVEIGSGVGNLKEHLPQAITTDLFPNPWLDLVCDGYELPFRSGALSHLILFDVFHHLEAPNAFLREARRVLHRTGRVIVFDPFISLTSWPVYGLLHHEPIGWSLPINFDDNFPRPRAYYAAQGNATRMFFRRRDWPSGWSIFHRESMAGFAYLLSGGFSKPAMYPRICHSMFAVMDRLLSAAPTLFGARCLVGMRPDVTPGDVA